MTEMRQSAERQRQTKATQRNAKERALRLRMNAWWQQRYGRRAAREKIHRARLKAANQAERSRARARTASEQQQRQAASARGRARQARGRTQAARRRAARGARAHRQRLGAG